MPFGSNMRRGWLMCLVSSTFVPRLCCWSHLTFTCLNTGCCILKHKEFGWDFFRGTFLGVWQCVLFLWLLRIRPWSEVDHYLSGFNGKKFWWGSTCCGFTAVNLGSSGCHTSKLEVGRGLYCRTFDCNRRYSGKISARPYGDQTLFALYPAT